MQQTNPTFTKSFSVPELFFVEKIVELLHSKTIDTYRARVLNPRTIIIECTELIKEFLRGRLPNIATFNYGATEAKILLESENECLLTFSPFSYQAIYASVGALLDAKVETNRLKSILIILKNFALNNNKDYGLKLSSEIIQLIANYDSAKGIGSSDNNKILENISKYANFLIVELLIKGYTKCKYP